MNIELLRADVNSLKVDAIINPASASKPVAEFGSVPVGHAVVTSGGNVLCKFVIHAIVPRFGDGDEDAKLRNTAATGHATTAIRTSHRPKNEDEAKFVVCMSSSGSSRAPCNAWSSARSAKRITGSCGA